MKTQQHNMDARQRYEVTAMVILPFVQPYRDFENKRVPSKYEMDLARWANRAWLFKSMDFMNYEPRKGFVCREYFNNR